jgi:hypothetical protein
MVAEVIDVIVQMAAVCEFGSKASIAAGERLLLRHPVVQTPPESHAYVKPFTPPAAP